MRRGVRAAHRKLVFRLAMRRYLADPAGCAIPGNKVLRDLVYGWGNKGYVSLDEYLAACIVHAMATTGPILECGSGLSTLLVAAVAKRQGRVLWSLEHSPYWAARVGSYLRFYGLDSVTLSTRPLKDSGGYCWYDVPLDSMPKRFDLVLCDGPPSKVKGGRYGLVPRMREHLEPGCVILLDDGAREQERGVVRRWKSEFGVEVEICATLKPYVKLVIPQMPGGDTLTGSIDGATESLTREPVMEGPGRGPVGQAPERAPRR
jgi:hypothetical protein